MLPWPAIETVLLDMDGTLIDLCFDNYFWRDYLPLCYSQKYAIDLAQARHQLFTRYQAVEGQLVWYCVDYWSEQLGLDIALLKQDAAHLIALRPSVEIFLQALQRANKSVFLVTNAHPISLQLKMDKMQRDQTPLRHYFADLISAHQVGWPKEQVAFWAHLQMHYPFNPQTTLLIDDNLTILRTAHQYGIGHLATVRMPDSTRPVTSTMQSTATQSNNAFCPDFWIIDDFAAWVP